MKKVCRAVISIMLLFFMIWGSYRILSWKDTSGSYLSSTQQLYYTPDKTIDVAFAGTSHCYDGVCPEVIWEEYGYSGFDLAVSGQDKNSTCHEIIELCKKQSPQVVFVDLYGITFERHAIQGNVYRNMLAMKTSVNSLNLVRDYVKEEEQQGDYILRWPIIHTRYRELKKYDFVDYEYSNFGRGAVFDWKVAPQESAFVYEYTRKEPISDTNRQWIDELCELSEQYDFDLVMMVLPCYLNQREQEILNGVREYLDEQEITVLDFNLLAGQTGLNYTEDFVDSGHLNSYGAQKISSYLGEYLQTNYRLTDHREDPAYEIWDRSLQYYKQVKQENVLNKIQNPEDWVWQVSSMKNLTVVLSLDGKFNQSEQDLAGLVELFGVDRNEISDGGKWIVTDHGVEGYLGNDDKNCLLWELGDETLKILNAFDEEGIQSHSGIFLDRQEKSCVKDGLNILVYDNVQEKLLGCKGFF